MKKKSAGNSKTSAAPCIMKPTPLGSFFFIVWLIGPSKVDCFGSWFLLIYLYKSDRTYRSDLAGFHHHFYSIFFSLSRKLPSWMEVSPGGDESTEFFLFSFFSRWFISYYYIMLCSSCSCWPLSFTVTEWRLALWTLSIDWRASGWMAARIIHITYNSRSES